MTVARDRASPVAAIVLAGGRSIRFGSDKLVFPLFGQPLLHHALRIAAACADEVVVVIAPHAPIPDLPADVSTPIRFARDPEPGVGPLAGLVAGLAATSAPVALVLGGDMPWVPPAIGALLLAAVARQEGAEAAALEEGHDLRPLPLAVRTLAARVTGQLLLGGGERRLRALMMMLVTTAIPEAVWRTVDPDGAALRDVDMPGDIGPGRPQGDA